MASIILSTEQIKQPLQKYIEAMYQEAKSSSKEGNRILLRYESVALQFLQRRYRFLTVTRNMIDTMIKYAVFCDNAFKVKDRIQIHYNQALKYEKKRNIAMHLYSACTAAEAYGTKSITLSDQEEIETTINACFLFSNTSSE